MNSIWKSLEWTSMCLRKVKNTKFYLPFHIHLDLQTNKSFAHKAKSKLKCETFYGEMHPFVIMEKDIWYLISYYFHNCNLIHRPKLNYLRINDKACQNCIKNNKLHFIRHINHYSIWFGYDNSFTIHLLICHHKLNLIPCKQTGILSIEWDNFHWIKGCKMENCR